MDWDDELNFDSVAAFTPYVSVVIPTYNRVGTLPKTIDSLCRQTYDCARYEIVVVDNNSTDRTRDVVAELRSRSPVDIKYLFEGRQGAHYARNLALTVARGDILYYTDDDMIADPDMLREIVKPFALSQKIASVTGPVLPIWEITPPDWVPALCNNSLLSLLDRPEHLIISPRDRGGYSCHQALRREAFISAGGYLPENTAGEWIGNGETGLNISLKDLGYSHAYLRTSITHHLIPPERMTQAYLNKRLGNHGNSDSYTDFRKYKFSAAQLAGRIIAHLIRMSLHLVLCCTKFAFRKPSWRINLARINYCRKRVLFDLRLLKDGQWRLLVLKNDWLTESLAASADVPRAAGLQAASPKSVPLSQMD